MLAAIIILFAITLFMLVWFGAVFKSVLELMDDLCEVDKRQVSIDAITNDILASFDARITKLEEELK